MRPKDDLTGQRFGKLTVTGPGVHTKGIGFKSPVICDCGNKDKVFNFVLVRGRKKSCGNCVQPRRPDDSAFR